MIGDVRHGHGKRKSTRAHGPEYKEKNSEGRSHKHVQPSTGKDDSDSGGHREQKHTGRRMNHPMTGRRGPHTSDKQAPHKQKERIENRHVDQGQILDEWCRGKRKAYR